jgi:branched-subunit amino acid aminotransferase/4-amino-4-deoxychorismate lyase
MGYILLNDQFFLQDETILKATNRGFKFGDGLFETMRMCNGKLQFAEFHADRMQASMKALKMDGFNLLDEYFLKQKTGELARKSKIGNNARFRLTIYREGEGLYTPTSNKVGYLLEISSLETAQYELNKKGLIVDIYGELVKPINKFSNYKTTSALPFVMAAIHQKQNNLDEVFLLNQNGFLCESTSSNVFVVYKNQVFTPALSEGCVAGVMRSVMMQIAKQNQITLTEAQINPQILLEAEEVFVTNAISGVRWVMGYGRRRYFNEVAKTFNAKLNAQISL